MAKSAITLAAPPADEAADALLATDGSTKLTVPAEAIAFVVMEEGEDGISGC